MGRGEKEGGRTLDCRSDHLLGGMGMQLHSYKHQTIKIKTCPVAIMTPCCHSDDLVV